MCGTAQVQAARLAVGTHVSNTLVNAAQSSVWLCYAGAWNVMLKRAPASEGFRRCLGDRPWSQPALSVLEGSCECRWCSLQVVIVLR